MNRAPILDKLEKTFSELGYEARSEPGAARLSMVDHEFTMTAEASVGSSYGYLIVIQEDSLLQIRLGREKPMLTPHQCFGEGRNLLRNLVENCEPFQLDWLKEYLERDAPLR